MIRLSGLLEAVGRRLRLDRQGRQEESRWVYAGFREGRHWVRSGDRLQVATPTTNGAVEVGQPVRLVGNRFDGLPFRAKEFEIFPASTPLGRVVAAVDAPLGEDPVYPGRVGGHLPSPIGTEIESPDLWITKTGKRKRQWVLASEFEQIWWDDSAGEFAGLVFPTGATFWRKWRGNGFWFSDWPQNWVDLINSENISETARSKRTLRVIERKAYTTPQPFPVTAIELIHLDHRVLFSGTFLERDEEEYLEEWDYDADVYVPPPQPCDPPTPPAPSNPGPAFEDLPAALFFAPPFNGNFRVGIRSAKRFANGARFTVLQIDEVLGTYAAANGLAGNIVGYRILGDKTKTVYPKNHVFFPVSNPSSPNPQDYVQNVPGFWQQSNGADVEFVGTILVITDPPPPSSPPPPPPEPAPACTPPPTPPVPGINVRRLRYTRNYEWRQQIPGVHLKRSGALARDWQWIETQARRTLDGVEQYNNKTYDINVWVPIVADKTGNAVIVLNLIKTGNATAVLQKKLYWSPSGSTLTELDLAVFEPILFEGIAVYDKGILTINTKDVPDLIVPEDGNPYLARVTRPVQAEAPTTEGKTLTVQFWDLPSGALTTKTERVRSLKIPEDKQIDWYSYHP